MRLAVVGAIVSLCHFGTPARADSETAVWLAAGMSAELTDRLELEVAQHLRFDQDVSRVSAVMPEVGLELDVTRFLELGVGYRYEYERDGMDFEGGHRVHVDASVEADVGDIQLGYRVRLQDRVAESGGARWRNRVGAELNYFKGWKPGISVESFHSLDDGRTEYKKTRFTLALEFAAWERDVQMFYRVDAPSDPMDPTMHIFGLELGVEL